MTQAIPGVTVTWTDSVVEQTDFLDALAHLDASTGNLPLAADYEDVEPGEFDKEDSPECVEI